MASEYSAFSALLTGAYTLVNGPSTWVSSHNNSPALADLSQAIDAVFRADATGISVNIDCQLAPTADSLIYDCSRTTVLPGLATIASEFHLEPTSELWVPLAATITSGQPLTSLPTPPPKEQQFASFDTGEAAGVRVGFGTVLLAVGILGLMVAL